MPPSARSGRLPRSTPDAESDGVSLPLDQIRPVLLHTVFLRADDDLIHRHRATAAGGDWQHSTHRSDGDGEQAGTIRMKTAMAISSNVDQHGVAGELLRQGAICHPSAAPQAVIFPVIHSLESRIVPSFQVCSKAWCCFDHARPGS